MIFAKSRRSDVVVQTIEADLLIYDLQSGRAHSLNETAALVWESCDGNRSFSEIAAIVSEKSKSVFPEELVSAAVAQLSAKGLMDREPQPSGVDRRRLFGAIGKGAVVALPLIATVVLPQSVRAFSSVCQVSLNCFCSDRGSNGGTCGQANCPTGCICGNLFGCNPGGRQCRGVCI